MLLEKCLVPLVEPLHDIGTDCVIEHRRSAHLHSSTSEREVAHCLRHVGNATDSGKALIRKCLRELSHLCESNRQNCRATKSAARDESIDVDLELESFGIDEWK